jgi:hypothetical protein
VVGGCRDDTFLSVANDGLTGTLFVPRLLLAAREIRSYKVED